MACTNCSTEKDSNGLPRGCQNKGTCGTDGCNNLSVFDWLSNMVYPVGSAVLDIVEVRFKNGRKDFYKYPEGMTLSIGDIVATETSPGHDIGIVSLTGELVKVQMKKKKVSIDGEFLKIYRKATQKDVDIWQEARDKEEPVRMRARELAIKLNLEMKISDVEFQGDGSKATFYYTASERVDFRQLIKDFAREFSIRIEMKQVGFRQEAARLGGVGSCGRELCCSTWLTDFRSVNTAAARYQQLSLNPQKLAGQCGKLKCCLNFELDTYLEAIKGIPDVESKIMTVKGLAVCQKIDIFKGQMWFAYVNNSANWYVLSAEQAKEIIEMNKRDEIADELENYMLEEVNDDKNFQSAVEQDSVTRFDQPKRRKKPTRKKEDEVKNKQRERTTNNTKSKERTNHTNENRDRNKTNETKVNKPQKEENIGEKTKDQTVRPNRKPRPTRSKNDTNERRSTDKSDKKETIVKEKTPIQKSTPKQNQGKDSSKTDEKKKVFKHKSNRSKQNPNNKPKNEE